MTQLKVPSQTRRKRRQAVLMCYGSAVVAVLLGLLKQLELPAIFDLSASIAGILALLASFWGMLRLLNPKLLGISDGPDTELDERQLQTRNQAYLVAYRILGGIVVLGLASASIFWNAVRQIPDSLGVAAFFWLIILLAISLPAAVLAWLEPDPINE